MQATTRRVVSMWTPHLLVRTHAHIFLVHSSCVTDVSLTLGSRLKIVKCCAILKIVSSLYHVLLGVLVNHFPMVTSSTTCSLSRPSASSIPFAGTTSPPSVSARWSGMSGCIANPTRDTADRARLVKSCGARDSRHRL